MMVGLIQLRINVHNPSSGYGVIANGCSKFDHSLIKHDTA